MTESKNNPAAMTEPATADPITGLPSYLSQNCSSSAVQKISVMSVSSRYSMTFIIENEGHTLTNAIRYLLMKDPSVEFAGYTIPHPSEFKVSIRVQTDGTKTAVQALQDAVNRVIDCVESIKQSLNDAIKFPHTGR